MSGSSIGNTIDLLMRHRSIRRFSDQSVPDEHIDLAVRAGQMASTSSAVQAYCLLEVTRPEVRRSLVALTGGQTKVAEAPRFFLVCADTRRHRLVCADAGTPYDTRLEAFLVAVIDASLFAQNMCIALESLGYGICYVGGLRNRLDAVHELIEFPDGVWPLFALCVGSPAQDPIPRPRLPLAAVYHRDRFPTDAEIRSNLGEYDPPYGDYLEQRGARRATWTEEIRKMFATPARVDIAAFYRARGANLD